MRRPTRASKFAPLQRFASACSLVRCFIYAASVVGTMGGCDARSTPAPPHAQQSASSQTKAPPASAAPTPSAPAGAEWATPLSPGPIAFFDRSCSTCHGPYGSLYDDATGLRRDDALLVQKVRSMVAGQAHTSTNERTLAALVAYQRSLVRSEPFLSITEVAPGRLSGEVTPGSKVELLVGDRIEAAQVEEHRWSAPRPSAPCLIRATIDGKSTTLDASAASHSHES